MDLLSEEREGPCVRVRQALSDSSKATYLSDRLPGDRREMTIWISMVSSSVREDHGVNRSFVPPRDWQARLLPYRSNPVSSKVYASNLSIKYRTEHHSKPQQGQAR